MGPVGATRSGWLFSATRMASAARSCDERILGVGTFGQRQQAFLKIREVALGAARGIAAIEAEQRDHQAKRDGGGDGNK